MFNEHKDQFDKENKHQKLPENDPTLKHVQLVVPATGNSLHLVTTQRAGTQAQINEIGLALQKDGECTFQERVQMHKDTMKQFTRMEGNYLAPMAQDINFIADFIRGGVSGAIGVSAAAHSPQTATTTATAALFQELAMARQLAEVSPCDSLPLHSPLSPAAPRQLMQMMEEESPQESEPRHMGRGAPDSQDFANLVGMCFDWIGILDKELALKHLFENTEWRKWHCHKNNAEMKQMHRMKCTCSILEKHITMEVENVGQQTMAGKIAKMEPIAFGGNVPGTFSWTHHKEILKEHDSISAGSQ